MERYRRRYLDAFAVEGVQSVATTRSNVEDLKEKNAVTGGKTVPPIRSGM